MATGIERVEWIERIEWREEREWDVAGGDGVVAGGAHGDRAWRV
ncbi:MAG: hypothetical protein ACOYOU_05630 [Kiritimatiellia bacterium]